MAVNILLIDYCRIPDKYAFLSDFGAALAPHNLYVADGYRGNKNGHLQNTRKSVDFIKVPQTLFRPPLLQGPLVKKPSPSGSFADCFDDLAAHLAELTRERKENSSKKQAAHNLMAAFNFTQKLIKRLNPALIIIWNQFHPLSVAAQNAAGQYGVKTAFIEYGLLSGTLNFDFLGQMGESAVARYSRDFDALSVDDDEVNRVHHVLQQLRHSGANRRKQPRLGNMAANLRKRAGGRPVVLFAGHNDHASGVVPYNDTARDFHSPVFQTSAQAATALSKLARKNGWFVIYKPHPFAARAQHLPENENLFVMGKADIDDCIDLADCVVTVLSQTSYVALIREKPLVMLGYNQLRKKDCHYQAEIHEDIEPLIRSALANGFTKTQQIVWHNHIARLLKYYLYKFKTADLPSLANAREPGQLAEIIHDAVQNDYYKDCGL